MIPRMYFTAWLAAIFALLLPQSLEAHFIWVYSHDGKVKVVFGEGLEPDQAQFLGGLDGMKAFTLIDGTIRQATFEKQVDGETGWFEVAGSEVGDVVLLSCPYGVFGRGDKTMYLDYSAKYIRYSPGMESAPAKQLALDLVPSFSDGQLTLTAYFKGQPLDGAEVTLESVETESTVAMTDSSGEVALASGARYVVRAKHVVEQSGEVDGQPYSQQNYYCTLVLDTGAARGATVAKSTQGADGVTLKKIENEYADFPRGMTSFGAAVLDNQIFVVGGKSGRAHHYARSYQNRDVYCLDLEADGKEWKTVGENLGLQGLAIVAHGGRIIRLGGLEARNKEGEDHDLHSTAAVMAFDPQSKSWSELPSMPEARSSFDACVVGDEVFVVGGWNMKGEDDAVWATDMLKMKLGQPGAQWERIDAPFTTRALAVRPHAGRLVVIGGIKESGGPTNEVHFYDLKDGQWKAGPPVPAEEGIQAFGCSAVSLDGHLLVSTYDGGVFRLADDASQWQQVHQLGAGRFFHQMLPVGKSRFALVGGSHMEHGSHYEIEVYEVAAKDSKRVAER